MLDEYIDALNEATARVKRLENQIEEFLPEWSLCPLIRALMTMRGISTITACILVTELGDLKRFPSPRELMSFLGLVPSEHTSDGKGTRGSITKTGNRFVRKALIESANSYRNPAKKSGPIRKRNEGQPRQVCEIAWQAQTRLCGRYRKMLGRGKNYNIVKTAIAREMCGFIWAIGQVVELEDGIKAA